MKYFTISLLIIQTVCILHTESYSLRASRNVAFDEWLSHLDPSLKGEERSALCTDAADGFYPFPGECTSNYYVCSSGTAYNLTCADGNVFEPITQTCVNPSLAPCKTTMPSTTQSTPRTTVPPFTCGADGNYAVGSCAPDYYICVGGNLYPQSCPSGVFNTQTSTCSSAEAAGCTTATPPPTTPFTCKDDGNYPAGDCLRIYYTCIGGIQYNETCPGNSVFYEGKCVSPENNPLCLPTTLPTSTTTTTVTTSTTTTLPTTTTSTTTTTASTTTTSPTTATTTATTTTPPTSTTSPTTITQSTTTTSPTTTTVSTTAPTTTSTTTASTTTTEATTALPPFTCPEENGFYPLGPNICSAEYYSCVAGAVYVKVCPAGIFDPVYKRCVLPESASPDCYVPPTTTATTTTTSTAPPPFVCPGPGQYPVPGSCTLYYVCTSSGSFVASCPVGQVFNPTLQFCEPPGNVSGCNYYSFIEFYQGMRKVDLRKAIN